MYRCGAPSAREECERKKIKIDLFKRVLQARQKKQNLHVFAVSRIENWLFYANGSLGESTRSNGVRAGSMRACEIDTQYDADKFSGRASEASSKKEKKKREREIKREVTSKNSVRNTSLKLTVYSTDCIFRLLLFIRVFLLLSNKRWPESFWYIFYIYVLCMNKINNNSKR